MPFDHNGKWTEPTADDLSKFKRTLFAKDNVPLEPTNELLTALAKTQMAGSHKASDIDIFGLIGKLEGAVDIVIPVYDGLHVLKPCLKSIEERTKWNHNIIIVDDCSPDPEIQTYLQNLPYGDPGFGVQVRNEKNRGFAGTVNRGVALGNSPYVCILNTDVLVTEGWLTKMLIALEADPRNVIVNPCTNNTAMTNVSMYPGSSYLDMAAALNRYNNYKYPECMPTGFCMMFRRKLWNEFGPFDEAYGSYGEESDFWFRVIRAEDKDGILINQRAVLADNAYLFHERGTSFAQLGAVAHMKQRKSGSERFHMLNPDFKEWNKGFDIYEATGHMVAPSIKPENFKRKFKGNIAWVVKSAAPCGGMNFIADIVNDLIERGYNAKICVIPDATADPTKPLSVTGSLRTAPIRFESGEDFVSTFTERVFSSGLVLAGVTEMTPHALELDQRNRGIVAKNHVQSWDVGLATLLGIIEEDKVEELTDKMKEAYTSVPNIVASQWVAEEIKKLGGEVETVITPGINFDLFHPRNRSNGDSRFTVGVLMTGMYKYKGFEWGEEFLKQLVKEAGAEVRILVIGPESVATNGVTCTGPVSPSRMADLMGNEIDVFVDPAELHSYGLPALEALASGCHVITRPNKGIDEYAKWWGSQLQIVDSPGKAAGVALAWQNDPAAIGPHIAPFGQLERDQAVLSFWSELFEADEPAEPTRIEINTPHLRKHGGPTTNIALAKTLQRSGHDLSISTIYTDWSPDVINKANGVPIRTKYSEVPESVQVVIINSDNPLAPQIIEKNPHAKFVMYKLSHNERFHQYEDDNLKLPWDHIMTSTEWLRRACLNPAGIWTHPAWDPTKVTTVGWYHYAHDLFSSPPGTRTYGTGESGFRLGTLVHPHPLKGSAEAMGTINGLKRKYEALFHPVGFGETQARIPDYIQYFNSVSRGDMAHAFGQLDVWLGASYTEGLGRMSLEAMSAGAAVVTTNTGAEYLKHGENCLLYEIGEGSAQKAAELIDQLVNDKVLFEKIVTGGYITAKASANEAGFKKNVNTVIKGVLA